MDDASEWRISNGRSDVSFGLSFPKNFNEWRTGDESKLVHVKTLFSNDFAEWHAEGDGGEIIMKRMFRDGSEWNVNDQLSGEPDITKLSIIFIPVIVSLQ
jgi:hypothetical protein